MATRMKDKQRKAMFANMNTSEPQLPKPVQFKLKERSDSYQEYVTPLRTIRLIDDKRGIKPVSVFAEERRNTASTLYDTKDIREFKTKTEAKRYIASIMRSDHPIWRE